jgi:hypothetical protein
MAYFHFLWNAMSDLGIPSELLSRMQRDRELIDEELPELAQRDDRMKTAADEDTFCGHLRRAIHASQRPLRSLAADAGVATSLLCDFLEGRQTLPSDVLDRLAKGVEASISLTLQ